MKDLLGMNLEEFKAELAKYNLPSFRAKQLFRNIHKNGVADFGEMTDLSKDLRSSLSENYYITKCEPLKRKKSGNTIKQLLSYPDGETVETVLMMYSDRKDQKERNTLCVSTQVGCAMGCAFCATGMSQFARNLTAGEIIAQIWATNHSLKPNHVTNIVLMGMGEPLANYDEVIKAIKLMNDPEGLNIGIRRITLSTSGLVPQLKKLAKEDLGIVLAISLHAPNDALRSELMPINRTYPLEDLMSAVDEYIKKTGKRVTFEYILLKDINDHPAHARELATLVRGKMININLIPYNTISDADFKRTPYEKVLAFRKILTEKGIDAIIREEMGGEIEAACGQLRRRNMHN